MEKMKLESANEYARKSSSDTKNKEDYCKHNVWLLTGKANFDTKPVYLRLCQALIQINN